MLQAQWRAAATTLQHHSQHAAASRCFQYWKCSTTKALMFEQAVRHHTVCLVFKSISGWKATHSMKEAKLHLLLQIHEYYSGSILRRAFRAWLVFSAQCLRQQAAATAAGEQVRNQLCSRVLWTWHLIARQERTTLLQSNHTAMIFRNTYLEQATFAAWQHWVRLPT